MYLYRIFHWHYVINYFNMEILKNRLPWLFAHNKQQSWKRMLTEQKKLLDAILLHNYKKLSFHEKKEVCTLFDAFFAQAFNNSNF
jgi:hypothetical protein